MMPSVYLKLVLISLSGVLAGPSFAAAAVTPCQIFGWSASDDPSGLDIRDAPDPSANVIGQVPPPYINPASEISPAEGWRAEFTIVGYSNRWFLIDEIQRPGEPYDEAGPGSQGAFEGRGWVPADQVMGAYSNTQMPTAWLLIAPDVNAGIAGSISRPKDQSLSIDGTLRALLACSGNWGLTESTDGTRGWWRGICSNQATNCS